MKKRNKELIPIEERFKKNTVRNNLYYNFKTPQIVYDIMYLIKKSCEKS